MAGKVVDKDKGFKKFFRRWRKLVAAESRGAASVTVGIQGAEARALDHEGSVTNLSIAITHEFGAPAANIPKRSFIRSTVDENKAKYRRMIDKLGKVSLKTPKGIDLLKKIRQGLFVLGETVRADIIRKIDSNIPPPLSPMTVEAKGDTLALVDTGQLKNAITSVVK
jgi:hypothetical protein